MEDIVAYSEEYHFEIRSVALCQILLGWPNEKREKTLNQKPVGIFTCPYSANEFSLAGRKYLRYKMSHRTMRKLLYATGRKLFLEIKRHKTK